MSDWEYLMRQARAALGRAPAYVGINGANPDVARLKAEIAYYEAQIAREANSLADVRGRLSNVLAARRPPRRADPLVAELAGLLAATLGELCAAADAKVDDAERAWRSLVDAKTARDDRDAQRARQSVPATPPSAAPGHRPATPGEIARGRALAG